MIFDAVPFSQIGSISSNLKVRAVRSLVELIEKKFGVAVMYDARQFPLERPDLVEPFTLARQLQERGILKSFAPVQTFPDEPPMKMWGAVDSSGNNAGGTAPFDDSKALTAALAESLERYLWHTQTDYFDSPLRANPLHMSRRGAYIDPARFAGFSSEQRVKRPELQLKTDSDYLWIRAESLVHKRPVYVPAQTVSGVKGLRVHNGATEPLIRMPITTGLATWPTLEGARLAGALEIIERDAYMIMWLNQLTLPRISLSWLQKKNETFSSLVSKCEQYNLRVHAIRLLTDAPTHVVCMILEDRSSNAPRFTIGIRAHGTLHLAAEKALTEALRARVAYRRHFASGGPWDANTPANKIGHYDRIYYWGETQHSKKLEFLIRGNEEEVATAPWENESTAEQLERVVSWCRTSGFECVSVSLGKSEMNPTSLSVEMVVIPELQPLYLSEKYQALGGSRWKTVPEHFGIAHRSTPFSEEPHPFS